MNEYMNLVKDDNNVDYIYVHFGIIYFRITI